jgi:hypothetical protein
MANDGQVCRDPVIRPGRAGDHAAQYPHGDRCDAHGNSCFSDISASA